MHLIPPVHDVQKEQGTLQERVSVLELQCTEFQTSNRRLTESWEREISSARSAEATFQQQLSAEGEKSLSFEAAAKEATAELEKLNREVVAMKATIQSPPSPPKNAVEDSDIVTALRAEVAGLQGEKEGLVRMFNTIESRYKSGDLVCFLLTSHAQ